MIGCFLWNPKDILLSRSSMQHIYPNFLSLVFQNKIETSFIEDKDSIIQNKVLKISHPNHLLWSCCEWAHKHEICNSQCYYPNACKILDYAKNEITTHQSIVQCLSKLPLVTMQTTSFSPLAIHEQFAHIPTTLGKYHGPTSRSLSNNVHYSPQSSSHLLLIKTCPKSNVTYLKHLCCCWLEDAISISFDL